MAVNRRNYYRILHVQPEAPEQVITASYRTLMSKLRQHPDLGGDTGNAALLNEAFAVLRDPAKRARYDAGRFLKPGPRPSAKAAPAGAYRSQGGAGCPFCHGPVPVRIGATARCERCDSPLAPPPARPTGKQELFGRRTVPRMSRSESLTLIPAWQSKVRPAQLRDLSFTGVSVITDVRIERDQVIRILGPAFDVLATVVNCRSTGRRVEVHASLLRAIFGRKSGTVVSVTA
jgi:curved DNA-binding protein CbpA